jgi:hypothetical protein
MMIYLTDDSGTVKRLRNRAALRASARGGRGDRQRAAGAGIGRRHRAREKREVESASAIIAVLLGCALHRCEAAALTDGCRSGGFTPEATVAARRANAPEVWV